MAILTPLRWLVASRILAVVALQIEQGAAAGGAGDVVGLEDAVADGLEDVEGEPNAGAGAGLAADEDGVADAVAEERADVAGGAEHGVEDVGFRAAVGGVKVVLEQDGMAGREFARRGSGRRRWARGCSRRRW